MKQLSHLPDSPGFNRLPSEDWFWVHRQSEREEQFGRTNGNWSINTREVISQREQVWFLWEGVKMKKRLVAGRTGT